VTAEYFYSIVYLYMCSLIPALTPNILQKTMKSTIIAILVLATLAMLAAAQAPVRSATGTMIE